MTAMHEELLFEIGIEEIPAGYIQAALEGMAARIEQKLFTLGLAYKGVKLYGTPRRLTLSIAGIESLQEDRLVEHIGPSKAAGIDAEGRMTKAAMGFARSHGQEPEQLQVVVTAKGEYLLAVENVQGEKTAALLPALLEDLVQEMTFPKSMRWANSNLSFARPIQWFLALYGGKPLQLNIENIPCGTVSYGHRFLAPQPFSVSSIATYLEGLKRQFVVADPEERKQMVSDEVVRAVRDTVPNKEARPVFDEKLLDIVTNLVEHPYAICGHFDEKFLQLPSEALITSMREHQKYFPVVDAKGKLLPYFVAVNNTNIADKSLAASGHERVLRARLEDGLFFLHDDGKKQLADRYQALDGIVFQQKLGTMREKTDRIVALATGLAMQFAPEQAAAVERAARLSKTDLLTSMVGEFPTLQGIMGKVYALQDGEGAEVAQAIEEHYLPLRAGGKLPESLPGALLGIADRIDTLVGCFAIGERPTGNKDAFGLRRQALGLIGIIRGHNLSLSLRQLTSAALQQYNGLGQGEETIADVLTFIHLRYENEQIASGLPQELVEAATVVGCDDLKDCSKRIDALLALRDEESFSILAASFKRVRNIVKDAVFSAVQPELFVEEAETGLFATLQKVQETIAPLLAEARYREALVAMLAFKEPVDLFFSEVMVMSKDKTQRQNRLNLLGALMQTILQVADISKMHVEKDQSKK